MKAALIFVLPFAVLFSVGAGCTCRYKGVQFDYRQAMCCGDFVVRGHVEGEEFHGRGRSRHRLYTLIVKEIFKGLRDIKRIVNGINITHVYLKTPAQKSLCGVTLPFRKDLAVTGYFTRRKLTIEKCSSWYEQWSNATSEEKSLMKNLSISTKKCTCLM